MPAPKIRHPRPSTAQLEWEHPLYLLQDRLIMGSLFKAFVLVYLIMGSLLGLIMVGQGEWRDWLGLMEVFFYVVAALWFSSLIIMLILYRNRMEARFILNQRRVFCEMRSTHLQRAVPYVDGLSKILGKPEINSNMRDAAAQSIETSWSLITQALYDRNHARIVLRNRWRTVLVLYCPPTRYAEIADFVQKRLHEAHPIGVAHRASPLPQMLLRSLLLIGACMTIFALPYPFEQDVFIPIYLLCFSIATAWIISLLGYAVLVGVGWSVGEILYIGFKFRDATLVFSGMPSRYRGFDMLYGEEWLALALCIVGLSYLAWDAWRALRGKNPSMLERDYGA
jgi:hypothetical protein